jgi:Protein  of unknown function (DUF3018)
MTMPDQTTVEQISEEKNRRQWRDMKGRLKARLNLPDTSTPEFLAEARRQAALVRGTPEEAEALDFIEAMMAEDGWDPVSGNE